jgi:hypothetical protein
MQNVVRPLRELGIRSFYGSTHFSSSAYTTLDVVLTQLATSLPIELMPGQFDPSNYALPQQPFHPCLFPIASTYTSVTFATNPNLFSVDGVTFLGTSGQTIEDLSKYVTPKGRIDLMEVRDAPFRSSSYMWSAYATAHCSRTLCSGDIVLQLLPILSLRIHTRTQTPSFCTSTLTSTLSETSPPLKRGYLLRVRSLIIQLIFFLFAPNASRARPSRSLNIRSVFLSHEHNCFVGSGHARMSSCGVYGPVSNCKLTITSREIFLKCNSLLFLFSLCPKRDFKILLAKKSRFLPSRRAPAKPVVQNRGDFICAERDKSRNPG